MHVVLVNYAYDPGIAHPDDLLEAYWMLSGWGEALLTAGAESVSVVQRFSRAARVRRGGVDYHFYTDGGRPMPSLAAPLPEGARAVSRLAPTVVHVNGFSFPIATRLLRSCVGKRVAMAVQHHADLPPVTWYGRRCCRTGLRCADALLFAEAGLAAPWKTSGIIESAHPMISEVVPAGTSMRRIAEAPRLAGRPALLWVGTLTSNKDPLTVLRGLRIAAHALPDAGLTMVFAGGPLLPNVECLIRGDRWLAAHVHLLGQKPHREMAEVFSGADLFVSGSHREGYGNALTEALTCGAMPVVTDIPSFRALTGSGRFGFLWQPGDAEGFADALLRMTKTDLAELRRDAAAFCGNRLTWPTVGARALEIYRAAIARRAR